LADTTPQFLLDFYCHKNTNMNLRLIFAFLAILVINSSVNAQSSVVKFSVPKAANSTEWVSAPSGSTWSCYNKTVKLRVNLTRNGGDGYAGKKYLYKQKFLVRKHKLN
jgi:hypothetical protein